MNEESRQRLLPITIGKTELMIDVARVISTEQSRHAQRNPTDRPPWGWLLGNADGLEVHCLDRRQGQQASAAQNAGQVLVVERPNGEQWGLLVDRIGGSVEVGADEVQPIEPRLANQPYEALIHTAEGPRLLLDADLLHPGDVVLGQTVATPSVEEAAGFLPGPLRMVWIPRGAEAPVNVGLSAGQVVEICASHASAPMLANSSPMSSIVVYDGEVVPVADYGRILGLASALDPRGRLLIARCTRSLRRVALPITGDLRTIELPMHNRPQQIEEHRKRWIRGLFEVEDGLLVVPDLDALTA